MKKILLSILISLTVFNLAKAFDTQRDCENFYRQTLYVSYTIMPRIRCVQVQDKNSQNYGKWVNK